MTSQEFYSKVASFTRVNPDMMFIIETTPTDAADAARQSESRDAWFAYLAANGLEATLRTWKAILNGAGRAVTVPTERPDIFDIRYVPRDGRNARSYRQAAE